jgi:hypothetical protein
MECTFSFGALAHACPPRSSPRAAWSLPRGVEVTLTHGIYRLTVALSSADARALRGRNAKLEIGKGWRERGPGASGRAGGCQVKCCRVTSGRSFRIGGSRAWRLEGVAGGRELAGSRARQVKGLASQGLGSGAARKLQAPASAACGGSGAPAHGPTAKKTAAMAHSRAAAARKTVPSAGLPRWLAGCLGRSLRRCLPGAARRGGGQLGLLPKIAEPHALGQLRTSLSVIGSDHRIIVR